MRIDDARNIYESLSTLMTKKLPIKMAFAIQKNMKQIKEIVDFSSEREGEIIRKYAMRDENGEPQRTEDGERILINDAPLFIEDMDELTNTEMPVELTKISMSDIERCDEDRFDSLSPSEIGALEEMIE